MLLVSAAASSVAAQAPVRARRPLNAFYELKADGRSWTRLFEVEGYYPCHSPRISADGMRIAFDAWKSRDGERLPDARVLICNLDGSRLTEVCEGAMPSWSPDGLRVACSRYKADQGVWVIGIDGKNAELIDAAGWGIQWSPDGESLAYTRKGQIIIHRVSSGAQRPLFPGDAGPYSHIYWNMTWSADSRKLAFIADTAAGSRELAIVDVGGTEFGFERRIVGDFNPMLSWNSDGRRLVFPRKINGVVELHELNPRQEKDALRVPGIPPGQKVASACWRPDGSGLIVLGLAP